MRIHTPRPRALLWVAATALLVACGESASPAPAFTASASGTAPQLGTGVPGAGSNTFVGNDTCPTEGAAPYAPSPPLVNSIPVVGEVIPEMPHTHVAIGSHVTYNHTPPTSGCHWSGNGAPASPGVYDKTVPPEAWVHNVEHGYVVVLYDCPSGCAPAVTALQQWLATLPPDPAGQGQIPYPKVLVTPYSGMPSPYAVVSWDYYLPLAQFDIAQVQTFYANHVGRSPESPFSP